MSSPTMVFQVISGDHLVSGFCIFLNYAVVFGHVKFKV